MDATLSTNDSASGNDSIAMTCASIPFEDKCPFYGKPTVQLCIHNRRTENGIVNLSKLLVSREFMDFKHYKLRDDSEYKCLLADQLSTAHRIQLNKPTTQRLKSIAALPEIARGI
jgi:hypothetical protein